MTRRWLASIFVCLLVLAASAARAQDRVSLTGGDENTKAFEVLLRATLVYDSAVGYAAASTPEYEAFARLAAQEQATLGYAKRLTRSGRPAARVYGAILLAAGKSPDLDSELSRLEEESTTVGVMSGCVSLDYRVGDLARRIRAGDSIIHLPSRPNRDNQ